MHKVQKSFAMIRAEYRVLNSARSKYASVWPRTIAVINNERMLDGMGKEKEPLLLEAAKALVQWAINECPAFEFAAGANGCFLKGEAADHYTLELAEIALQIPYEEKNASPPLENMRIGG